MTDEDEVGHLSDEAPEATEETAIETPEVSPAEPAPEPEAASEPEQDDDEESRSQRRRRQRREREERLLAEHSAMAEQVRRMEARLSMMQAPNAEDYEPEDYIAERAAFIGEQRAIERQIEEQRAQGAAAESERAQMREEAFKEAAAEARTKYADFDAKAFGTHWNPTPTMVEVIQTSGKGPDVAYYLGSNPQEAARIVSLSPLQQAAALGMIEASLSKPKPVQSSAPPPITPLRAASTPPEPSPDSMSYEDYKAWRLKRSPK